MLKDSYGNTPLHEAAKYGCSDVAELLLAKDAEVDARNNLSMTPLHWAVSNGHVDVAKLLLQNKADVNAKDKYGTTPLHEAVVANQARLVELLTQASTIDLRPAILKLDGVEVWVDGRLGSDLSCKEKTALINRKKQYRDCRHTGAQIAPGTHTLSFAVAYPHTSAGTFTLTYAFQTGKTYVAKLRLTSQYSASRVLVGHIR